MDNLPELSLYVHLPWCDKKCPYCDFNITTDSLNDSVRELFNALKNDLDQSEPLINQRPFKSIYFGGGTPSKVPTNFIKDFLDLPSPPPKSPGPFAFEDKSYLLDILQISNLSLIHI